MEKDIKQSKITITKNLYDSRKLLENYYSQKTKELTKDLPIEETKKIQNLLISLKSRIDLKSYIEDLHEYIRVLVQNFYYGDLIDPMSNKELFNANRINFQVYLLNSLELICQLIYELKKVLGKSENVLINSLNNYINKALDENKKLLDCEKKYADADLTDMYNESLKEFLNFIRIKRDGGSHIPSEYLNQFGLDSTAVKTVVKGVWQYLIPGGLVPARLSTIDEVNDKYSKCNCLSINLYPKSDSDYKYICYTDIIDKIYRSLLTESSELRKKLSKRTTDPFTLTINDHITSSSTSLEKIQEIIREYKDLFEVKLLEGVKQDNDDLKRVIKIMNYDINNPEPEINIGHVSDDAPFVVVSKINNKECMVYSDKNGKIKFDKLADIPLIRQIVRLAHLTRGKQWTKKCLRIFDPDNRIKIMGDGLSKDIKKNNQLIINYHRITEKCYKKLENDVKREIIKYKISKKNIHICTLINKKTGKEETIECKKIINDQLHMYEICVTNLIKNSPNISKEILMNIPRKVDLSQGIGNIINNPKIYQTAVIDELISHKIQIMMLKSKYLPKLDGNGRLVLEKYLNMFQRCINDTLKNIYKLNFVTET